MLDSGSDTVQSITGKDFSKICRLCLKGFFKPSEIAKEEFVGVFDDNEDEDCSVKMINLIDEFVQIKVFLVDLLYFRTICLIYYITFS